MKRFTDTAHPHIKFREKFGLYYFRGTVNGKFTEKSLQTESYSEAKNRATKLIASLAINAARYKAPSDARVKWAELFQIVTLISQGKGKKRREEVATGIRHLKPFLEKYPFVNEMETSFEEIWAEYRQYQCVKNPDRSLFHDRKTLVTCLRRAFNKGWLKRLFEAKDFSLNEAEGEDAGWALTDEEANRLLNAANKYPKSNIKLQIMLSLYMMMRRGEILHLCKEEIDIERCEINLDPKRLKTRRRRGAPIPIADAVYPLLKRAYDAAEGTYIFPAWFTNIPGRPIDPCLPQTSNRYFWEKVRRDARTDAHFHCLRHTAITNLIQAKVPGIWIEKVGGVSAKTMKRIYAHVNQEAKTEIREIFNDKFVH